MEDKQKTEFEHELSNARKQKLTGLAKTVFWSTLPILASAGVVSLSSYLGNKFENKDVGQYFSFGLCFGMGLSVGKDYITKLVEYVGQVKDSSSRIKYFKEMADDK